MYYSFSGKDVYDYGLENAIVLNMLNILGDTKVDNLSDTLPFFSKRAIIAKLTQLKQLGIVKQEGDLYIPLTERVEVEEEPKEKKYKGGQTYDVIMQELEDLVFKWNAINSKLDFPKVSVISSALKKSYSFRRTEYTLDQIKLALNNYITFIKKSDFYTHRFSLHDFVKQQNGVEKFINYS